MKAIVKRSSDPNGQAMSIFIVKMTGRIYKEGKDDKGNFIDQVGEPDNRYQVYGDYGNNIPHKVYPDKESIKNAFIISGHQTHDVVEFFES